MIIQYVSDVHLEFKSPDIIPKLLKNINADVLVLAGDICAMGIEEDFGKFIELIKYYSPRYKNIIHVAGNHEYYAAKKIITKLDCMDAINRKLKALSKTFKNYLFLNCDAITLQFDNKPYMFIGATLWAKIDEKDWKFVENNMNDYTHIYINRNNLPVRLTVAEMQKLHLKHKFFIKKAIEHAAEKNIPSIIITHHKSLGDTPEHYKTRLTQAYETDITALYKLPVRAVIWGHTHKHFLKEINGITYVSNPKGYPSQHCGFKADLGIHV